MHRNVLNTALIVALLSFVGCARNAIDSRSAFRLPWQNAPEQVPGVKAPKERISELKEMAKSPLSAEQGEKLAAEIQHEQDPLVRMHIVRTLAKIPGPTSAKVLHAGLDDPEESVRIACCEAWGERGGPEAVEELSTVLQAESSIDVRMAAARALGTTKNGAAVKPLGEVLADSDPAMQRRAIESLKGVSGKDYGYDVQAWRQYAAGETVQQRERGLAERLFGRSLF
jgi:HEAT repeat protein